MVDTIIKFIDEEIAQLQQVKRMLSGAAESSPARRGRPRKADAVGKAKAAKPRRTLSAKARKAIADAQRKRWANKKVAAKDGQKDATAKES